MDNFQQYIMGHAEAFSNLVGYQGVFPVFGKKPLVKGWNYHHKGLNEFHPWHRCSGYGVNLNGLIVLDYDYKQGVTDLPETLTIETPRGYHFYYIGDPVVYNPGPKVDLKQGSGAFVIGPGSIHESDYVYRIVNDSAIALWPRNRGSIRMRPGARIMRNPPDMDKDAQLEFELFLGRTGLQAMSPNEDGWVLLNCLMPDHLDVNPSFRANLVSGYWECYGCKRKGFGKDDLQDALEGNYMRRYRDVFTGSD